MSSIEEPNETERATGVFSFELEGAEDSGPLPSEATGGRLSEECRELSSRMLWLEAVGVTDAVLE